MSGMLSDRLRARLCGDARWLRCLEVMVVLRRPSAVCRRGDRIGIRGRRGGRVERGNRRWEQPQRVDVAVFLAGTAYPEVDEGVGSLPDRRDGGSFCDVAAGGDGVGAEMLERDRVAVGGADGDRFPARRDGAGEADGARGGSAHGPPGGSADVDAAVLAAGVRIVTQDEGSKHRPVDGPGPGERGLHADLERDEDRKQQGEAFHRHSSSLSVLRTGSA